MIKGMGIKIAICGDIHISQYSSIVRSRGQKYSTRLENCIQTLNWFEKVSKENGCELEIFLGDTFDAANLDSETVTAIQDIEWNDTKKIFLCGNHEMGNNDLSYNSANVLSQIGTVITKPTMDSYYGCELFYIPYILESNRKPLREYIDTVSHDYWSDMWTTDEYKHLIIFSHNDIAGVEYGNITTKTGFALDEINENCDLFINGHIHNQCQPSAKVLNLGVITGLNFGENAEKYSHTMGILDTYTLQIELINNPYAFNFYKFEINNEQDIEDMMKKCKDNSVLSIKVKEEYAEKLKEEIEKNKKITDYRLVIIQNKKRKKKQDTDNDENIYKDHIEQFSECCIKLFGDNEILYYELNRLK